MRSPLRCYDSHPDDPEINDDLPTRIGTLAAGTKVRQISTNGNQALICIDPPDVRQKTWHNLHIPTHMLKPP